MERPPLQFKDRYPRIYSRLSENIRLLNGGTVSFDIDAVTQATWSIALTGVSHKIGKSLAINDLVTYWELKNIVKNHGFDEAAALQVALTAWNNENVYLNSPTMPGISTLLRMFNEIGVSYKFISSRPTEFADVTKVFFNKAFPWVDPKNIILGRKDGEHGGDFKARMIKELGVVLHVEDALEEARVIIRDTNAKVLVVPQPWNENGRFEDPKIKYLGHHAEGKYSWTVLRFLAGNEVRSFLGDVAQSY